jgi:hypothetical protein
MSKGTRKSFLGIYPSRNVCLIAFSAVAVFAGVGCVPAQPAAAPASTSTDEAVTYSIPNVKAVVTGTETQTKASLIVAVVPMPFAVTDTPTKACVATPGQSDTTMLGGIIPVTVNKDANAKKPFTVTTTTGVDFAPKTLTFQIKVTNNTDQVMKLDGAYPKLNINSEDVVLSEFDTKKFHDAVLLPNESHSFQLAGPDWGHNPDEAIITFTLAGMPTEIDKAGNVAKKEIFSWTFKAALEKKSATTKKLVETQMLSPTEAVAMNCT